MKTGPSAGSKLPSSSSFVTVVLPNLNMSESASIMSSSIMSSPSYDLLRALLLHVLLSMMSSSSSSEKGVESTDVAESVRFREMSPSRDKIFARSDANFDTTFSTTCSGSQGGSAHTETCPCDPTTSILRLNSLKNCRNMHAHNGQHRLDTPMALIALRKCYVTTHQRDMQKSTKVDD